MSNEKIKDELDYIADHLMIYHKRIKGLIDTRALTGIDALAAKSICTDLMWAIENCSVIGNHAIGKSLEDLMGYEPMPKYAMVAMFRQQGFTPVCFHIQAIDHKPTEDDLKLLKESLKTEPDCEDLIDLITVEESSQSLIDRYYSDSKEFRTNGIVHGDPHRYLMDIHLIAKEMQK